MDEIELGNIGPPPEQELEDDDDYGQTNIDDEPSNERYHTPRGGDHEDEDDDDRTNLIDPRPNTASSGGRAFNILSSFDFNRNRARDTMSIELFGDGIHNALRIDDLFDDLDVIPDDYRNPRFIKYLMDKHNFEVNKTVYFEDNSKKYDIKYKGKRVYYEDGTERIQPDREITVENNIFENPAEFEQFKGDMKCLYDKWKGEDTKKRIKKAGIVGGVLIAIGSLITGLALGLKRTGHSMVHDSEMKWKKLTPAEKKQIVIPWTELEKASGKGAIIVGDYIYVLIGGSILVYALSK